MHHTSERAIVSPNRDLERVETALRQVDTPSIDASGWFSDFLAEYVAKAYGVTILLIRASGVFTYFQVPMRAILFPVYGRGMCFCHRSHVLPSSLAH